MLINSRLRLSTSASSAAPPSSILRLTPAIAPCRIDAATSGSVRKPSRAVRSIPLIARFDRCPISREILAPSTSPLTAYSAEPGTPVLSGDREVGHLASSVTSPHLGPIALAILRREVSPGDHVAIAGADAEVITPPFE